MEAGTFVAMLHYVYTGEMEEGLDIDLNKMIYAAEKYDLPGLMDLLFFKMKSDDIQEEFIPDLLIIADKYQACRVKKLALEKIRAKITLSVSKKIKEDHQRREGEREGHLEVLEDQGPPQEEPEP